MIATSQDDINFVRQNEDGFELSNPWDIFGQLGTKATISMESLL